jgi:large subunit ribosomal protein L15
MITLNSLRPAPGSKQPRKRVGRGQGSGHGKTACRGEKGQRSRSGGGVSAGFLGGQMPLYRQLPKRGFKNPFGKVYGVLNVGDLAKIGREGVVDIAVAKSKGLVRKRHSLLKILGGGEIAQAVTVRAHAASVAAVKKIEAAGGKVELIAAQELGE